MLEEKVLLIINELSNNPKGVVIKKQNKIEKIEKSFSNLIFLKNLDKLKLLIKDKKLKIMAVKMKNKNDNIPPTKIYLYFF